MANCGTSPKSRMSNSRATGSFSARRPSTFCFSTPKAKLQPSTRTLWASWICMESCSPIASRVQATAIFTDEARPLSRPGPLGLCPIPRVGPKLRTRPRRLPRLRLRPDQPHGHRTGTGHQLSVGLAAPGRIPVPSDRVQLIRRVRALGPAHLDELPSHPLRDPSPSIGRHPRPVDQPPIGDQLPTDQRPVLLPRGTRDQTVSAFVEMTCPFCGEAEFDPVGLKLHFLNGWCDEFEKLAVTPHPLGGLTAAQNGTIGTTLPANSCSQSPRK